MDQLFKNNEELLQIQQKRLNFINQQYLKQILINERALKFIQGLDSLDGEQLYELETAATTTTTKAETTTTTKATTAATESATTKKETTTIYIDKCHELKMELETLKFKVNQKQDLGEVIRRVKKEYLYTLDKDLHKQYIELVKLYNRIGE